MIGERLGNWVLERELGSGGMGHVYLARWNPPRDPAADPPAPAAELAAVKVLAAGLAQDAGFQVRFQREIDVLRQLDHPNIVRCFESGVHNGHFYFAMEYVEGPNFEELLHDRGRVRWPEVLDMALQVSLALKHAHDRGVIHRDLKPSNLLRARAGTVKLTDFGIAKVFAGAHLTATGGVVGTAEYLSPEQATGKPVTRRSDLYSLGVVLYTLLTGRNPFIGTSTVDLLHKHCFAQFEMPRKLVPEIPHDLEEVVARLLEKDPTRRPADGQVLHRQLDRIRRKLDRKAHATMLEGKAAVASGRKTADAPTVPESSGGGGPGPATLMSRLMRQELEAQKRGGPLRRFFNQPWVLVALLLFCVGVIAWRLWPSSADSLFQHGEALMHSAEPDDWDRAWRDYFEPLNTRYPDHPYQEQVAAYRRQLDELEEQRQARNAVRRWHETADKMSEAAWFYEQGWRLRQQGDAARAERVWRDLVRSFRDVPAERPWVELAEKELDGGKDPQGDPRPWGSVRKALERARQLRDQGKIDEAEEIWQGLEGLYREDAAAQPILEEVRRDRGW
jgi:eukaryotic-like serine/threonine-protein kinase